MKKHASLSILSLILFGTHVALACHIPPNPPSCPECPPGSTLVDINFDDNLAGTLVGGYDLLQRYTSDNNTNIGDGLGFTIDVGNNNPPCVNCGGIEVGALYDTDRRQYYTNNPNDGTATTTWYDNTSVENRNDQYVAKANRGQDSDLEVTGYYNNGDEYSKWSGGNMEYNNLGNALIIQEHVDCNDLGNGHLDYVQGYGNPGNDDYAPDDDIDGGYIAFEFESAMSGFGFTLADLDIGEINDSNITFFDTNGASVEVSFSEFSNGLFSDRGTNNTSGDVTWGNNNANRIDTISVSELNNVMQTSLTNIGKVQFNLSGSGGITHINYCYSGVPEASTYFAGAGLLALIGFHFFRNRKKIK